MVRPRRRNLPPLLSPQEVRELSSWLARKDLDDAQDHSRAEAHLWREGLLGLRKLWAASLALAGDASALPKIAAWLEDEDTDDHETFAALARAVRVLASRDPKHRKYLRDLADHEYAVVQREAVLGLDPNEADERTILEKLLQATSAPWLAAEVQKKLQKAGLGQWWRGLFSEDPSAGLAAEEQGELLPVARRLIALFAAEELTDEDRAAFPPLLEKLPARPAVDAARTLLRSARHRVDPFLVLSAVCRHEGAAAMWVELLDDEDREARASDISRIFGYGDDKRRFPEPFSVAVAEGVLFRLARYTSADTDDVDSPAWRLGWVLREIWPPGRDPKAVLDLLLRWGEDGAERDGRGFLCSVVSAHGAGHPWARATFERALRENFRPPWQLLEEALPSIVADEPAEVRLTWAAEVVQKREPGPSLAWAMGQLRDANPAFLVERYDDPILRPYVIEPEIPAPLVERVRADFLAGRLTPEEVESTLHQFAPAQLMSPFHKRSTWKYVARRPEEGRSFTDVEWDALRTYRERHPATELIGHLRLSVSFPRGEWHPRDLAWFERAREAMLEDSGEEVPGHLENLVWAATHKADARVLPALEDALDRCQWVEEEEAIEEAIAMVRQKLGLPAEEGAAVVDDWGDDEEADEPEES